MKKNRVYIVFIMIGVALWAEAGMTASRGWDAAWSKGRLMRLNRLTPTSAFVAHFVRAGDERSRLRLKEALVYYRTVSFYYPDMDDATGMQGFCYYHLGDLPRALAAYEKAAQLNTNFFWWHYNRGVIYWQTNDTSAAMSAFEAALAVTPVRTLDHIFASKIDQQFLYVLPDKAAPIEGLKKGYANVARILYRLKNPSVRFPQGDTSDTPDDNQPRIF